MDTLPSLRETPQESSVCSSRDHSRWLQLREVAAVFMIVLNVTFFILLVWEDTGRAQDLLGVKASSYFCFLNVYFTVHIFYFDVNPKCAPFFVFRYKSENSY